MKCENVVDANNHQSSGSSSSIRLASSSGHLWKCNQHWRDALAYIQSYQERLNQLPQNYLMQLELYRDCESEQNVQQRKIAILEDRAAKAAARRARLQGEKDRIDCEINEKIIILGEKRAKLTALRRLRKGLVDMKLEQTKRDLELVSKIPQHSAIEHMSQHKSFQVDSASICVDEMIRGNVESSRSAIFDGSIEAATVQFPAPTIRSVLQEYPLGIIWSRLSDNLDQFTDRLKSVQDHKPVMAADENLLDLQRTVLHLAAGGRLPDDAILDEETFQLKRRELTEKSRKVSEAKESIHRALRVMGGILGKTKSLFDSMNSELTDKIPCRMKRIQKDLENRLIPSLDASFDQVMVSKSNPIQLRRVNLYHQSGDIGLQLQLLATILLYCLVDGKDMETGQKPCSKVDSTHTRNLLLKVEHAQEALVDAIQNRTSIHKVLKSYINNNNTQ